jgi:ATP-dependent DNA helicase RecQ
VDLSADLQDYEERRAMDQEKLRTMIQFCQTTQCRTRYILEHFGEEVDPEWTCRNCDACDDAENVALMARGA